MQYDSSRNDLEMCFFLSYVWFMSKSFGNHLEMIYIDMIYDDEDGWTGSITFYNDNINIIRMEHEKCSMES